MSNTPTWQRNMARPTQPNQSTNQAQVPEIAIEVEIPAIKKVLRFFAENLTQQWNSPPNRTLFWLGAKDEIHRALQDTSNYLVNAIGDVLRTQVTDDFDFIVQLARTRLQLLEQRIRPEAFRQRPQAFAQEAVRKLQKAYKDTARAALSMRRKLDLLLKSIIFWILKHYELSDPAKRELQSLNLFNPKKVLGFDTLQRIREAVGKELKVKNAHRLRGEAGTLAAFRALMPGAKFDMIWTATPSSMATILQALHFRHDKYGRLLALYLKKYGADRDPEEAKKLLERRFYDPVLARFITFGHAIEKYKFYAGLLPALDRIVGQLNEKTDVTEFAAGAFANLAKSFIPTSGFSGTMG